MLADLFACAFGVYVSVCAYFVAPFILPRPNEMKAIFGRRACCSNVSLYFLCQGGVRSWPCFSVSHPFSPEGNSLSSSRRPSTHCCPFVSDSLRCILHRPPQSYFCPSLAWLSCHVWSWILLQPIHPCSVIMIRMDASHTHTRPHTSLQWGYRWAAHVSYHH